MRNVPRNILLAKELLNSFKPKIELLLILIEVILSVSIIIFDVFIPTLLILGIAFFSLFIHKQRPSIWGLKKTTDFKNMILHILISVIIWTILHLAVTMPLLNHLTGSRQDLSMFENLKGNTQDLIVFIFFTWTLAAFGEEIVYRGFLQHKLSSLVNRYRLGQILSILTVSILFGLAHREQGMIGVVLTTMDSLFFSFLKHKYNNNLWAAIFAHGLSNSIGLIAFYFWGPIYGLW